MAEKTLNERLAWLAGILDGEGNIGAYYNRNSNNSHGGNTSATLVFLSRIANTDYRMLKEVEAILKELGVGYNVAHCMPKNERCKPLWQLTMRGKKRTERFLFVVLPFLINKKERAELVLSLIKHRRATAYVKGKNGPTDSRNDQWLKSQLATLTSMNSQGGQVGGESWR